MKKNKLKVKNVIYVLVALIVVVAVVMWALSNKQVKVPEQETVENKIDDYGYVLTNRQTDLFKSYFQELVDVLNEEEIDEEKEVSFLAKLFIADFYNLDNKWTNTDIGGVQFVHSKVKDNFILNATNTLYLSVENNLYGERKQTLPIVKEVEVESVTKGSYKYLEEEDKEAYTVSLKWSYEEDLGYDTSKELIFVHEDNKLALVEMK